MKRILLGMLVLGTSAACFAGSSTNFYEFSLTSIENNGLSGGCGQAPGIKLNISICGDYDSEYSIDGKKHKWSGTECYSVGKTSSVQASENGEAISTSLSVKLGVSKLEKLKEKLLKQERNKIFLSASLNKSERLLCGFFTNNDTNLRLSSTKSTRIELNELENLTLDEAKQYKINFHGNYNYGLDPSRDEMRPFSVIGILDISAKH